MYKKVLVPLDGSAVAEEALVYVRELAASGTEVTLLCVSAPEEGAYSPSHEAYIQKTAEAIRRQLAEVPQTAVSAQPARIAEVHGKLAAGRPADEILRHVQDEGIDLILMATHGRSGIKRWAMGSVADKVLRASKVPVWLVRAGTPRAASEGMPPKRMMLVLLDGSKLAESVLPHVEALAKHWDGELVDVVLLEVCEPMVPSTFYPAITPVDWEAELSKTVEASKSYLHGVEARLSQKGIRVRSEVLVGKPADEIVDYAKKNSSNLIVMATHGRSGVNRWVYGSVAEKVLAGAANPILLVKSEGMA